MLIGLPDVASAPRDADKLPPVNTIGVGKPVFSSQPSPIHCIVLRNLAQRIAMRHNMSDGTARAKALRLRPVAI